MTEQPTDEKRWSDGSPAVIALLIGVPLLVIVGIGGGLGTLLVLGQRAPNTAAVVHTDEAPSQPAIELPGVPLPDVRRAPPAGKPSLVDKVNGLNGT